MSGNIVVLGRTSAAANNGTEDVVAIAVNTAGQIITALQTGDNAALNMKRVSGVYLFTNITTATTTVVKSGVGLLGKLIINKAVLSGVVTIYDNTAGSGTRIATITYGAALLSDPPLTAHYEVQFATGLTIVTSAATDITVCYI